MKAVSAVQLIAVVALLVRLFRGQAEVAELRAALLALTLDRDEMRADIQSLNTRLDGLRRGREVPVTPAATTLRAADPSGTAAPPEKPGPTPGVTAVAPAGWWKNGKNPDNYVVGVDTVQT